MPFDSIECVLKLASRRLAVAIDTNFPGEDGRSPGVPDSTEFIQLHFAREISHYAPQRKRD
jgi:glycerophosphoryl diester phosphodiesterase